MHWSYMFGFLAVACFGVCVLTFRIGSRKSSDTLANGLVSFFVAFLIFGSICALTWGH